ncbi:hypothetical protein J4E91_006281 [Alternaria rosae]|nr:hypothetical protein J4E91_006281 [Alternaria rosae]
MRISITLDTDIEHPKTLTLTSECPNLDQEIAAGKSPYVLISINNPETLSSLGKTLATPDPNIPMLKPPSSRNCADDRFLVPRTAIKELRIGIFAPISSDDELTLEEKNGHIAGPVTSSLIEAWRTAFRCIPERHCVERVQFDMRCEQPLMIRHVVRLLQEVAKRTMGRELVFGVVGCQDVEKDRWLEASLPGEKDL